MIDNKLAPYGAFALRVALGVMFLAHAYLKLALFSVAGFEGFLAQSGLPTILAWPIILGEVLGGLAILPGFYSIDYHSCVPMVGSCDYYRVEGLVFEHAPVVCK